MDVCGLTKELVRIPSPSGDERAVGEFLADLLSPQFRIRKQKVGNRFNLLARVGTPKLLFATHLDTVPKQLPVRESSNYLYGRGACDAKGIIASMVCACLEAKQLGLRDFGLLFDVGEETDFSGIKSAIKFVNPELVIVGEPTNLRPMGGQKGLLGVKARCYGRSASGAVPQEGISAVSRLIRLLDKIEKMKLPYDRVLGSTTINIGRISGGTAVNVVPDYAEADMELRTTTSNKQVLRLLYSAVGGSFEIAYSFEPVFPSGQDTKPSIAPYFTEMYFWSKKARTFILGPGRYELAHTGNERISKKDLKTGKEMYLDIIKRYAAERTSPTSLRIRSSRARPAPPARPSAP